MELPSRFTKNIRDTFGDAGEHWLANLQRTVSQCIDYWGLTNCHPVDNLSFNYVCLADSNEYGPVVLKIGVKLEEIESEYRTLTLMDPDETCRCFDFNRDLHAMLLEQLLPGQNLHSLASPEQQVVIGGELVAGASGEISGEKSDFPAYGDWLKRSFSKVKEKGRIDSELKSILERAERFFSDLQRTTLPDRLIHGDFHHQNILMKGDKWVLIDPQGVKGKSVFDCGRFMLNQLDIVDQAEHRHFVELMATTFAKALSTEPKEVLKGAYVEKVLSCSWTLEGNISPVERQEIKEDLIYTDMLYGELIDE